MNILTIFAGRQTNLEVLKLYLDEALKLGILDEVHFWNYTRKIEDELYLKSISNVKRTSSNGTGKYLRITPSIQNQTFELNVKATNDIHIQISTPETEYEIILAGWNNTRSVIRENETELCVVEGRIDTQLYQQIQIRIHHGILQVMRNRTLYMYTKIKSTSKSTSTFDIQHVSIKTGHLAVGDWTYETTQHAGYYFMDTCTKTWKNYYQYYKDPRYEQDIILKCDDDIVFMDLYNLPSFLEFVRTHDYDLVFANTINHGVCSYYQQNKYRLIPEEVMQLEYPNGGIGGSLWENGKKADTLHRYFIHHHASFLDYDYQNEIIPIHTSFSINFFGYKGKQWNKIVDAYLDDEHNLTVDYVKHRQFKNVLYSNFYVSHLSYYMQNETGISLSSLLEQYKRLYTQMQTSGRFARLKANKNKK